jgi:hypothetical protein
MPKIIVTGHDRAKDANTSVATHSTDHPAVTSGGGGKP